MIFGRQIDPVSDGRSIAVTLRQKQDRPGRNENIRHRRHDDGREGRPRHGNNDPSYLRPKPHAVDLRRFHDLIRNAPHGAVEDDHVYRKPRPQAVNEYGVHRVSLIDKIVDRLPSEQFDDRRDDTAQGRIENKFVQRRQYRSRYDIRQKKDQPVIFVKTYLFVQEIRKEKGKRKNCKQVERKKFQRVPEEHRRCGKRIFAADLFPKIYPVIKRENDVSVDFYAERVQKRFKVYIQPKHQKIDDRDREKNNEKNRFPLLQRTFFLLYMLLHFYSLHVLRSLQIRN